MQGANQYANSSYTGFEGFSVMRKALTTKQTRLLRPESRPISQTAAPKTTPFIYKPLQKEGKVEKTIIYEALLCW